MNQVLFGYIIIINALGLGSMLLDKCRARKNLWRISENTLLTIALLGGSLGSLCGMYLFHHKTKKPRFTVQIPMMLLLHCIALFYLLH